MQLLSFETIRQKKDVSFIKMYVREKYQGDYLNFGPLIFPVPKLFFSKPVDLSLIHI